MSELEAEVRRYGLHRTIPINAETVQEMASLIAKLWEGRQNATIKTDNTQALYNALEVIEKQREVMRQARDKMLVAQKALQRENMGIGAIDSAIAALDAALNHE